MLKRNTAKDPNRGFNGDVKVLKEFYYEASKRFGEPAVGELFSSSVSEYDFYGKRIKVESYDNDGEVPKSVYEYNDKGTSIRTSLFDENEKVEYIFEHKYTKLDDENNWLELLV